MLSDPFKLLGKLLLAGFKIAGYCVSFGFHALWCFAHKRPELAGDAFGELGRSITDAIAGVFER